MKLADRRLWFLWFVLCGVPQFAVAHMLHFSSSDLRVELPVVFWTLQVHLTDLEKVGRQIDQAPKEFLAQHVQVAIDRTECPLATVLVEIDPLRDMAVIPLTFTCPAHGTNLHVAYGLFFGDFSHKHLVQVHQNGLTSNFTFSPLNPDANFSATTSRWPAFTSFLALGFEHILLGYDHLLFVLSLLFGARRFRTLLLTITAFTLAHSMTLALAVFDLVTISPQIVEPMIAASILCVAALHYWRGEAKHIGWALLITFGFGLIHGLGFSSALKEAQLVPGQMLVPLIAFNLGVEGGQLLFIVFVYPLTLWLHQKCSATYQKIVRTSLIAIMCVALYWFATRIVSGG